MTFAAREWVLRYVAFKILESGEAHAGIETRLAALLVLADRLLVSCAATADHGQIPRRLAVDLVALDSRAPAAGTDLLRNSLEGWLKAVLHRGNPECYPERQGRGRHFLNLYQVISDLDLLSREERFYWTSI